ncbi:MAG TPA: hypothetical protein ENJ53_00855 [Phaeodactylibacter sp.]|nr:hypothetical protein [Phaeodactylibacter sp.]
MKNTLKTRKVYSCTCDSDGNILEKNITNRTEFDSDGNVSKEEFYQDGETSMLIEATYQDGKIIKSQQVDYINEIEQIWENKYDELGRRIEKIEHYHTGGFIATKYEYNLEGKMTSEYTVDDEGEVSSKIIYEYDTVGNLIKKIEYDTGDFTTPWVSTTYKYDINKNLIEKEEKFAEKEAVTSTFEYDEAGELIGGEVFYTDDEDLILEQNTIEDEEGNFIGTAIIYHKEGIKKEQFIKRNEQDKIVEEETHINGNLDTLTKIEYNDVGDMTAEKYLSSIGNGEYMQWTAQAFELEYWDAGDEEEE